MYRNVASVMSKPAFINILKAFHELLNKNKNYVDDDEIVERINYIANTLSFLKLTELFKDDDSIKKTVIEKAQVTLDNLKNTTNSASINFINLFNFMSSITNQLNVCISALVEDNKDTIHNNGILFIKNIIPIVASYKF